MAFSYGAYCVDWLMHGKEPMLAIVEESYCQLPTDCSGIHGYLLEWNEAVGFTGIIILY